MEDNKESKKKRSLSLSNKLNDDLEDLGVNLGVNVQSYVINELAKSVQRDRLSLVAKNQTESAFERMLQIMSENQK